MTYTYAGFLRGPGAQDAALGVAWLAALAMDAPVLRGALLLAIPIVLAWGAVTLHFPSRVEIDADGIAFSRYARVHRFAWREVTRLRLRSFVVRDRVFVRIEPSGPLAGRYWLVASLGGFDALVAELRARQT
jgi:hypothetical protein